MREEERDSLTRPEGSTLIALATDAAAEILAAVLPDREPWTDGINAADPKLLAVLADWAAAGRDVDALRDACANLGKPKSDPTRLLVAHIGRAVSEPIPRLVRPSVTAGQGQDVQPATKPKTKPTKAGEPPTIPAGSATTPRASAPNWSRMARRCRSRVTGSRLPGRGGGSHGRLAAGRSCTTADERIRAAVLDDLVGSSEDGNVIRFGEDAIAFYNLASAALAVA